MPEKPDTLLTAAHEAGMMAFYGEIPRDANPYPPGTDLHRMWDLSWRAEEEDQRWRDSDAYAVEEVIEELPEWERREEIGANELGRYVKTGVDHLLWALGFRMCPTCILDERRAILRDRVDRLLALPHPDGEWNADGTRRHPPKGENDAA